VTRKSRGLLGIEAAIILIVIVLVAAYLAYSVVNVGSTSVGKVKTVIGTGLSQASSSLQASGTILGLMCLEGGSGCGEHSSLGMVTYPIKLGAGGTPVDLDYSNTVVKYLSNSVEFDDIYNGTVDVEIPIVYVMDTGNNRVQIIDADGDFIKEFGSGGPALGQFNSAFGIDVTPSGIIYVADRINYRIQVFDSSGNNPFSFGSAGGGPGQFGGIGPFGVAYETTSGNVIVSDPSNNRIQIFDSSGNYLSQFPTGSFPFRVATDGTFIYVTMPFILQTVEVYDFAGNFQFSFGGAGAGLGQFTNPVGIEVTGQRIIVSDFANRVQVFDTNGNAQFQFGSGGGGPGQFSNPWDVDVDGSGNIYVTDNGANNRVQIFDSSGNYISEFGNTGVGPGQFNAPAGIAVASYDGNPTTSVGVAAGRGLITTNMDPTFGPSASNTAAWIFFSSSKSNTNSVLEYGEHSVIGIAHAPQDRPNYSDKIRIELLTASGGTYTITVPVPTAIQPITELG
jgi:flagellin-like protein